VSRPAWLSRQSRANPSLPSNSLLDGNIQGNSRQKPNVQRFHRFEADFPNEVNRNF